MSEPGQNPPAPDEGAKGSVIRDVTGKLMMVPRIVIGTLVLFSIAINFANVIGRYVFLSPIIWAEEVMIFIMVWCVFIGAILVSWDGRHLKMDLLSTKLKSPLKQIVNAFAVAVFLIACGFIVAQSWKAVTLFSRLGQESTVAGIPMVIPHSALLVGFAVMIVGVAVRYRDHISGRLDGGLEGLVTDADDADGKDEG